MAAQSDANRLSRQFLLPHGGGVWIRCGCAGERNFGRKVAVGGTCAQCNSPSSDFTDSDATHVSWYESELVPGLLQTEDYARTVIRANKPGVDEAEIEQRVHVRMARQTLLTRVTDPPVLQVVLNEAILHRPVGDEKVMVRQLERLIEADGLATVSVRVMPFSAGLHHGIMSGPFEILRFPLNGNGQDIEPPTVYAEGFTGALYLDKPSEVDRYDTAFTNIWLSSLNENASQELITQAIRELGK